MAANEANVDPELDKPGFFHFDKELSEGRMDKHKVQHLYTIHQIYRDQLPANSPELCATENTLGVFICASGSQEAQQCFLNILGTPPRRSINTLSNALYVQGNERDFQLQGELDALLVDESDKGRLERARAICERGYFASRYIFGEVHNIQLAQLGMDLLETGIREGSDIGMTSNEASVWKYYLFRATKTVCLSSLLSGDNADITCNIMRIIDAFLEFYVECADELRFYKGHALIELTIIFTRQKSTLNEIQRFTEKLDQNEMLRALWNDPVVNGCEVALNLCPDDYEICHQVGGVYSDLKKFTMAEEYIKRSLDLNSECNLLARKQIVIINRKQAFRIINRKQRRQAHDLERARELLHSAKTYGRKTEQHYKYVTVSFLTEMMDVCHMLVVQQHEGEYEPYLDEALKYGARAVTQMKYQEIPRTIHLLQKCVDRVDNYVAASKARSQDAHMDEPGNAANFLLLLMFLTKRYHEVGKGQHREQDERQTIVADIARALECGWQKHAADGDAMRNIIRRYTEWDVILEDRLIQKVIRDLRARDNKWAKGVCAELCRCIVANPRQKISLRILCSKNPTTN